MSSLWFLSLGLGPVGTYSGLVLSLGPGHGF